MDLPTYFKDFVSSNIKGINLTSRQRQDCITGHKTLRDRLKGYDDLKDVIVATFLQGSYVRHTIARPKGAENPDVDVVVVTKLHEEDFSPEEVVEVFIPFLEKYYKDKYVMQGRSIGIQLSYVDLDFVITSAPSEAQIGILENAMRSIGLFTIDQFITEAAKAETWQPFPLRIPDRDLKDWQDTHPMAQAQWTRQKNAACNSHYVNVVRALKWWRKETFDECKPKGYPLEHIIGQCCPDGISSIAKGITYALENIVINYADHVDSNTVPFLPNHGIPHKDVLERLSAEEFAKFYGLAKDAAITARKALDSDDKCESIQFWTELFGSRFPQAAPGECDKKKQEQGGYTSRAAGTTVGGGLFG
ncbi:nucleotidyltransferase (plasmid) [Desulfosarcina ovata subsp. sediminis]|uniref:Nucleotidyltransferase n=1 Tax=Desulfosarcina ovata subsp. sediminis TaxID=885957 RepID=A0A5K8A2K8_9BACT|nr:nucleotidyltransferase [Desulfosarcina ovata]BBO86676.1 nucleotidyltransferase [Desulfosarcina ovata subsp. sediminis]